MELDYPTCWGFIIIHDWESPSTTRQEKKTLEIPVKIPFFLHVLTLSAGTFPSQEKSAGKKEPPLLQKEGTS